MELNGKLEASLYSRLAEVIRRDIAETLKKKGINVRMVRVDIKSGLLNVSLNLRR